MLAIAAAVPYLVASLTLVTGFNPGIDMRQLSFLAGRRGQQSGERVAGTVPPRIRFIVGDQDECGHCAELKMIHKHLKEILGPGQSVSTTIDVKSGASHDNIG